MKNYLILLSLLCCSLFSTIDSNLDEAWSIFLSKDQNARILEIALEVRSRSDKYSDLKDLEFILSDEINISTPDKLIPTILHFLSTELNFDTSQIIIEELSRNSLTSGREPVFLIYNSSHDLIMIVKGFTKVNLIQEISALEKLYSLHLNNSTTVAPLAVCSVKIKNLTLYFMAQTVAPGKSLIDVVSAINNTEGEDRAQKFNSIQKAVKRLSEAIAELHQNAPKTDLVTREFDYLDVFIPPFTLFQDVLEENGIEVNREELEAFCIDLGGMVTTY